MSQNYIISNGELYHYGIKGMQWGRRRYQNADGSLTPAGIKRYARKGYEEDSRNSNEDLDNRAHKAYGKYAYSLASNSERRMRAEQYVATQERKFAQEAADGHRKAVKVLANIGTALAVDQMILKGAGRRAVGSAIKTLGRAAISAYVYARGGRDIKWYDK